MWWRRSSMRRVAEICSSGTLNWLWPLCRFTYITSCRATRSAISSPRSSAMRARDRSRQALIPAPVQTSPSRMKIGSASTSISGCSAASWCAVDQWVVARFPSSSPAAASRCAPTQTDVTRRVREARAFTRSTSPASTTARTRRSPSASTEPGTMSVSMLRPAAWSKVTSGRMRTPAAVVTGSNEAAASTTSYAAASPASRRASENTSGGPVTSSRSTPSNTTMTTSRPVVGTIRSPLSALSAGLAAARRHHGTARHVGICMLDVIADMHGDS